MKVYKVLEYITLLGEILLTTCENSFTQKKNCQIILTHSLYEKDDLIFNKIALESQ